VGHKPRSVGWGEAAALPLTALTAWELLFVLRTTRRRDLGPITVANLKIAHQLIVSGWR
jgi:NADPH:quinone reductase-like Zn-dependent oxidoreductase